MNFIDFFKAEFVPLLSEDVKVTFRVSDSEFSNFGELTGLDLDATRYSGYIYYWGDGLLDYMVYDMQDDKQAIDTTLIESKDFLLHLDRIKSVIRYFTV